MLDRFVITAGRMSRGEPVAEGNLYGREACDLIRRGLVDRDTMTAYRSGAFLARRNTHWEAAALAWEADAKERHETAKHTFRDTTPHIGGIPVAHANAMKEAAE
jgi:hypothetical protein